ncbi:hypothetical protein DFP73DRAFT_212279 [Morchella snyderi]|nr:hypothetical protein DFP73DRAFT_212279 [Morchella snyderi]
MSVVVSSARGVLLYSSAMPPPSLPPIHPLLHHIPHFPQSSNLPRRRFKHPSPRNPRPTRLLGYTCHSTSQQALRDPRLYRQDPPNAPARPHQSLHPPRRAWRPVHSRDAYHYPLLARPSGAAQFFRPRRAPPQLHPRKPRHRNPVNRLLTPQRVCHVQMSPARRQQARRSTICLIRAVGDCGLLPYSASMCAEIHTHNPPPNSSSS